MKSFDKDDLVLRNLDLEAAQRGLLELRGEVKAERKRANRLEKQISKMKLVAKLEASSAIGLKAPDEAVSDWSEDQIKEYFEVP